VNLTPKKLAAEGCPDRLGSDEMSPFAHQPSTDVDGWTTRKASPSDHRATAGVLARAFADNPCYAYMHPRLATRPHELEQFFLRNLAWHQPVGLTWVVTDEDRAVAGTVTLEPPQGLGRSFIELLGHWVLPTLRQQGLKTVMRIASTDAEFKRRYRAMTAARDYWHVHAVAVDPAQQRRGAASAMLRAVFRELDTLLGSRPAPVVLSTQREQNLALYRRFGFALVDTMNLGKGPGAYRTWFMRRAG
jgi:ribosomal protein S18 acetylase RimI-like enzyme